MADASSSSDDEADTPEQPSVSQAAGSDSVEVDEDTVLERMLQATNVGPSKKSKKQKKRQLQQQAQMAAAADFISSDREPELERAADADSEGEDKLLDRTLRPAQDIGATKQLQLKESKALKKKQRQQQAQIAAAGALGSSDNEPDIPQQAADVSGGAEDMSLSSRAQSSHLAPATELAHAQQVCNISCFIYVLNICTM